MNIIKYLSGFLITSEAEKQEKAKQKENRIKEQLRLEAISKAITHNKVPAEIEQRLKDTSAGKLPWISTMSPTEMLVTRKHGVRPISMIASTCWMQYGQSWTLGHSTGWRKAVDRMRAEAVAAGANAVVDVKLKTIGRHNSDNMDFSLIGTAVHIDNLTIDKPAISTTSAAEFIRLMESGIIPVGISIGCDYEIIDDRRNEAGRNLFRNRWENFENDFLVRLWSRVRKSAFKELIKDSMRHDGNGILAHINFNELIDQEYEVNDVKKYRYLARHIIIGTVVKDLGHHHSSIHDVTPVIDISDRNAFDRKTSPHNGIY